MQNLHRRQYCREITAKVTKNPSSPQRIRCFRERRRGCTVPRRVRTPRSRLLVTPRAPRARKHRKGTNLDENGGKNCARFTNFFCVSAREGDKFWRYLWSLPTRLEALVSVVGDDFGANASGSAGVFGNDDEDDDLASIWMERVAEASATIFLERVKSIRHLSNPRRAVSRRP